MHALEEHIEVKKEMGNKMVTYNKYKSFLFFIKKYKLTELVPPEDLKEVFSKFAGGGSHMSVEQLYRFLVEHQGEENFTLSDSEKIVDKVLKLRRTHQETVHVVDQNREREITLDDIFRFLFLDEFNGPLETEVKGSQYVS
jgi:phosphatidylinositol phospholipase C delta